MDSAPICSARVWSARAFPGGSATIINPWRISRSMMARCAWISMEELNRKLCYLHTLTMNGRLARQNRPTVAITYFSPCTDIENDWYGCGGQYKTITMLPPSIPWSGDLRIRGKGDSLSSTAAWKPPVSGRSGRRAGRGAAASSPAAITSSGNTT